MTYARALAGACIRGGLRRALQAWDGLIELLPVAIYVCDADGTIVQYNRRAVDLWGRTPSAGDSDERFCGAHRLYFHGRPTPHEETPMADVLRSGQPVRGTEGMLERPDGSRVWVTVWIEPIQDETGNVIGAINCFHETTAQKLAEAHAREQDRRLAATYERATIGIVEVDAEGRRLWINDAGLAMTGVSREELIGRSIFDDADRDGLHDDREQFQRLVGGEIDRYSTERKYRGESGQPIWISVMCSAVRDDDGRFLYAVRVFDDITKSKQIADALAESQSRLAATYEQATIGISEADAEGNLLRVNEASCALTGFSREELLSRGSFFKSMRAEDIEAERDLYRKQVAGEIDRYTIEKRIRRKDGAEIYVSVMSSSVRDQSGQFRYAVRVIQDITERKLAEERLRASEQRLRELLEALPAATYTTDAQGRITFYNEAAVEFSGRVPTIGSDEWCVSWRLYHPDGTPMRHDECPMAVALREGRVVRDAEAIAERPDGTRVPFIPYPTPLFDDEGNVTGAINMLVDITDRKRAEDRQKTLIDELNHRVKNTLATVQSLARQSAMGAASVREFQERFQGRLIALSEGHDQLTRESWEQAGFEKILRAALSPYSDAFASRISIAGEDIDLRPRAALTMTLIFHELVTNAVKYGSLSGPSGELQIEWSVDRSNGRPQVSLLWQESNGPRVEPPKRKGFGTKMVERSIVAELGGEASLQFESAGLRCALRFPLAESVERRSNET